MANLFDLKAGKYNALMGKLAKAGFTAEMAEEILQNPKLAELMVGTLKQQPAPSLVHRPFIKPEAQIARVNELRHERGWGISDAWLTKAEKSVPKWPDSRLVAVTLVPYLDDVKNGPKGVERTFQELWAVAAKQQHASWRWGGYDQAGPERLQLLKGIEHKPGLRWEVIDLGCQRNEKPMDVRRPEKSPHAGILASAALHPEWIKAMDGENVPHVWVPGYEVNVSGENPWRRVSRVNFYRGDRAIELDCGWYNYCHSNWAVPSFVRE
jgi:hypothetical protein